MVMTMVKVMAMMTQMTLIMTTTVFPARHTLMLIRSGCAFSVARAIAVRMIMSVPAAL